MDWNAIRLLYYRIYIKHRSDNTYVFLWCINRNGVDQKGWKRLMFTSGRDVFL